MATGRYETLRNIAQGVGLYVSTYSPGDGVTRYRFTFEDVDYFATDGIYTALGIAEAEAFVLGARVHAMLTGVRA